jgi:hypothetical protein
MAPLLGDSDGGLVLTSLNYRQKAGCTQPLPCLYFLHRADSPYEYPEIRSAKATSFGQAT